MGEEVEEREEEEAKKECEGGGGGGGMGRREEEDAGRFRTVQITAATNPLDSDTEILCHRGFQHRNTGDVV